MASEQVLDVAVRRHVFSSEQPFQAVLDGIFGGISQPGIRALFARLAVPPMRSSARWSGRRRAALA